jgi:hypothetical protein
VELGGVAAGDALELLDAVGTRVDLHGALGAAERHVDDRAFVGHQRGERHHLVFIDGFAVANTALGRHLVMAMLDAPCPHDVNTAVRHAHGKLEPVDAVGQLDLVQEPRRVRGECRRGIEVAMDVVEQAVGMDRHDQRPQGDD